MNKSLMSEMELVFKPRGIVGYSACCRLGCTGAYDEDDDNFKYREQGIFFFKLFLSGMNYEQNPRVAYVQYESIDYINQNWESEKRIIDEWCRVLGLRDGQYSIEKPETEDKAIAIRFVRPLDLEPVDSDEEEPTLIMAGDKTPTTAAS